MLPIAVALLVGVGVGVAIGVAWWARRNTSSPVVVEPVVDPVVVPPEVEPPLVLLPLLRYEMWTNPLDPAQTTGCHSPEARPRNESEVPSETTAMIEAL